MERHFLFLLAHLSIIKMSVLPNLIYKYNLSPIKMPTLSIKLDLFVLNFLCKINTVESERCRGEERWEERAESQSATLAEWRQSWQLRTATSLQPTRRWGAQSYDHLQLSFINRMSGLGRQSIPETPTKTHTWWHLQVSLEKPEWRISQVKQTPDLQNRTSTVLTSMKEMIESAEDHGMQWANVVSLGQKNYQITLKFIYFKT